MSWTAPDFIDSFAEAIAQHPDFVAMSNPAPKVFTYWPSPQESWTDDIIVGFTASDDEEHAALGQKSRRQSVTLSCAVRVVRPGAGQAVARQVRERAEVLLSIVSEVAKNPPDAGDAQTISAIVRRRTMDQFPTFVNDSQEVRVCLVEFDVSYEARVQ